MQIPILSGIYSDASPDFRTSYPRNLIPVPKDSGISKGYLRPADGVVLFGVGPGIDRAGINWNGLCYRVMGTKLVRIDAAGVTTTLGDVGSGGQCSLDYSFDKLAIASGGRLYLWNGVTLVQVTDPDLGLVLDVQYIDGYFMTTDGTHIVVTELVDPTQVDPLKYGSSELDPDPVMRVLKLRNEAYAVNRYTIEVFNNVGGTGFPFRRNDGAQIHRGALGTYCAALFDQGIAFLGSGRKEPPAVWVGAGGASTKISTREIDTVLQQFSEAQLAASVIETRVDKAQQFLILHLPDRALCYDGAVSVAVGEPIWFTLDSGTKDFAPYRARNLVWCFDKWLCGDPTSAVHGYLTNTKATHYGMVTAWEFGTAILYNAGHGAIVHDVELVGLPGTPNTEVTTIGPPLATYTNEFQTLSALSFFNGSGSIAGSMLQWDYTSAGGNNQVRFDGVPNHENGDLTYVCQVTNNAAAFAVGGPAFLQHYWSTAVGTGSCAYWIQLRGPEQTIILLKGKDSNQAGNLVLANVAHTAPVGTLATVRIVYTTVGGPGKQIQVYVNGSLLINVTDTNGLSLPPYLTGQIGLGGFTGTAGQLFFELVSATYDNPQVGQLITTVDVTKNPTIWTSYSLDGRKFSQEKGISAGKIGDAQKRLQWRRQGSMRHWRLQRFRGTSDTHMPFARLEANIEGLT